MMLNVSHLMTSLCKEDLVVSFTESQMFMMTGKYPSILPVSLHYLNQNGLRLTCSTMNTIFGNTNIKSLYKKEGVMKHPLFFVLISCTLCDSKSNIFIAFVFLYIIKIIFNVLFFFFFYNQKNIISLNNYIIIKSLNYSHLTWRYIEDTSTVII